MEYTNEFEPIHGNKSNQFTSSKMFLSFKFKSKALLKDCNKLIKKTQLQNHPKIKKIRGCITNLNSHFYLLLPEFYCFYWNYHGLKYLMKNRYIAQPLVWMMCILTCGSVGKNSSIVPRYETFNQVFSRGSVHLVLRKGHTNTFNCSLCIFIFHSTT